MGLAPERQTGRTTAKAAMMRRHEQIAIPGLLVEKLVDSWLFQISGQEDPPPQILDGQCEAVLVVAA